MALATLAESGDVEPSGGLGGMAVALMGAIVDAILDGGGAAVAFPYLCALFQDAAPRLLATSDTDNDTAVSFRAWVVQFLEALETCDSAGSFESGS